MNKKENTKSKNIYWIEMRGEKQTCIYISNWKVNNTTPPKTQTTTKTDKKTESKNPTVKTLLEEWKQKNDMNKFC